MLDVSEEFHQHLNPLLLLEMQALPCPSTRLSPARDLVLGPLQDTTAFFSSASLTSKTKDASVAHSSIEFVNDDIYLVDLI